jgi:hypothetical protein
MRHLPFLLVFLSLATLAAQDQSPIFRQEEARIEAARAGLGLARFYRQSVMVNGRVRNREQAIPSVARSSDHALEGMPTVTVRGTAAIAIGTERVDRARVRFVRVWVAEGGEWRIGAYHETRIAEMPAEETSPAKREGARTYASGQGSAGEVLKAHWALNEAWARHDLATYSAHTAASFVTVDAAGHERSRDDFVRGVSGDQARVIAFSDDTTAMVFGEVAVVGFRHQDVQADGTPNSSRQWRTRVFERNAGTWQQVIAQASLDD